MRKSKDAANAPDVFANKGREQRYLGERFGRPELGTGMHPLTKERGIKGASNVGEDETSGSE